MFEAEQIAGPDLKPALTDFLRLPFRRFEFSTPMSLEHAVKVLDEVVEPPRKFGWPTSTKRGIFEGKVAGSRFKINRILSVPNSFLPIVEGRMKRDGFSTVVSLTLRMLWPVMFIWLGIVVFLIWNSLVADSHLAASFSARVAVLAVTAFLYLVASVSFAIEVRIAMTQLLGLLRSGSSRPGLSF
jgi:hypothetical protein